MLLFFVFLVGISCSGYALAEFYDSKCSGAPNFRKFSYNATCYRKFTLNRTEEVFENFVVSGDSLLQFICSDSECENCDLSMKYPIGPDTCYQPYPGKNEFYHVEYVDSFVKLSKSDYITKVCKDKECSDNNIAYMMYEPESCTPNAPKTYTKVLCTHGKVRERNYFFSDGCDGKIHIEGKVYSGECKEQYGGIFQTVQCEFPRN